MILEAICTAWVGKVFGHQMVISEGDLSYKIIMTIAIIISIIASIIIIIIIIIILIIILIITMTSLLAQPQTFH